MQSQSEALPPFVEYRHHTTRLVLTLTTDDAIATRAEQGRFALTPWSSTFLSRPSRGLRPKEPLRLQPHPSYAACPGRALSRAAGCGSLPLRAGAAAIAASEGAETCGWVAARKCRLNFLYMRQALQDGATLPLTIPVAHEAPQPADVMYFSAQVVEVDVDRETGQVTVLKVVTAHDVGTVINPLAHQGQIDGGVVTGLGLAMTEELVSEGGQILNGHLGAYKLPTIADIPPWRPSSC